MFGTGGTGGTGEGPLDRDATLGGRDDETESRGARCEKKEPMLEPHEPNVDGGGFGGSGCASCCAPTILRGRRPRLVVGVGGTSLSLGLPLRCSSTEPLRDWTSLPREVILERLGEESDGLDVDDELGWRCIHPRTPATALKRFVDPAANVLDTASRAGASCCSSLSSWIPSDRRSPMSDTTEGLSLHGCLPICIVRPLDTVYCASHTSLRRCQTAEGRSLSPIPRTHATS